ncbi:MAG: sigma-70 family RNA polymerase sigma factor [Treponemataceae bacterium]
MQKVKTVSGNQDQNLLSMYLKDINRIPLLTREQEIDLAHRAQKGDRAAKNKMVSSNLRFVVNVAKKYQNHGLDLTDLISEGNIGLLIAIDRFDVSKGYHFISYAVWWIRQSILKSICEKSRMIRLPLNRANELVQIEKAKKILAQNQSEEEEITEIARMLNMNVVHIKEILAISNEMISLDSPVKADGGDTSTMSDFIEDVKSVNPEMTAVYKNMVNDINDVLGTLSEKEASVIKYRFGLDGKKAMSLKEIGDTFHLTKERIRQIEKKAIHRLKHPSRLQRLQDYVAA